MVRWVGRSRYAVGAEEQCTGTYLVTSATSPSLAEQTAGCFALAVTCRFGGYVPAATGDPASSAVRSTLLTQHALVGARKSRKHTF